MKSNAKSPLQHSSAGGGNSVSSGTIIKAVIIIAVLVILGVATGLSIRDDKAKKAAQVEAAASGPEGKMLGSNIRYGDAISDLLDQGLVVAGSTAGEYEAVITHYLGVEYETTLIDEEQGRVTGIMYMRIYDPADIDRAAKLIGDGLTQHYGSPCYHDENSKPDEDTQFIEWADETNEVMMGIFRPRNGEHHRIAIKVFATK